MMAKQNGRRGQATQSNGTKVKLEEEDSDQEKGEDGHAENYGTWKEELTDIADGKEGKKGEQAKKGRGRAVKRVDAYSRWERRKEGRKGRERSKEKERVGQQEGKRNE